MRLGNFLAVLAAALCCASYGFAGSVNLQFDESGNISLTNGASPVIVSPGTGGGFLDSLGPVPGGTLVYTLPSAYSFSVTSAVIVEDGDGLVSDLLYFSGHQVLVWDSPAAAASESGGGDLAKAYLTPRNGVFYDAVTNPNSYITDASHPIDLNSPSYMSYALGWMTNGHATIINEMSLGNGYSGVTGAAYGGAPNQVWSGDQNIPGYTGTSITFVSTVPLPPAANAGLVLLGVLGGTRLLRRMKVSVSTLN